MLLSYSFLFFWALEPDAALFRAVKYLEFVVVLVWVLQTKVSLTLVAMCGAITGCVQALVGIVQFVTQKSVGLHFLAESPLMPLSENVAEITTTTGRFIRAYGTVPSPNILAFFLVIALLSFLFLYCKNRISLYVFVPCVWIISFALCLTFSRGVTLAGIFATVLFLLLLRNVPNIKRESVRVASIVFVLCAVSVVTLLHNELYDRFFVGIQYDNAIAERIDSYSSIRDYPTFMIYGAGGGNTVAVSDVSQPIHNTFALVLFEWGVVFLVLFVGIIGYAFVCQIPTCSAERALLFVMVLSIVSVFCFDHFFLTTQQGGLVLFVVLGLALRSVVHDKEKYDILPHI